MMVPPELPTNLFPVSKNAARRLAHTSVVYNGVMRCRDGRKRHITWLRLDMSYTDRSKYNGDGTLKVA